MQFLSKFEGPAYAAFRIVTGFLFLWHGSIKLLGYPVAYTHALTPLKYTGGAIELVLGACVMLGLFTRVSAFICSGTMAVAYWMFHWTPQGLGSVFPIINKGELAVLFCFAFFYIACRGSGGYSLDLLRK